jgi:membrane protein required for colicin V production
VTGIDYVVLGVVGFSTWAGWRRGVLTGLFALGSAFCGLVLAAHFYAPVGGLLGGLTTTRRAADLLGFAFVFVATLAAGAYAGYRLRKALDRAHLGGIDRGLGAAVGFLRAGLVCSAIYLGLTAFPVRLDAVRASVFAPLLVAGTDVLAYLGSEELRRRFAEGYDSLERVWNRE